MIKIVEGCVTQALIAFTFFRVFTIKIVPLRENMEVALIIADASIFISLDLRIYEMAAFCFSTRHDRADWVI